ncbi:hypothetical protein M404DRAFT_89615, partial [Pisolithus tinctorius Marx 270]
SASGSQCSGSGVNRKYVKDNLPLGSTVDNIWRRVFISVLAHFAAGYDNPWTIPTEKFTTILQVIWDRVYEGEIEHTITNGGPIFHIAKQSLNNWCGRFAAAATAVITTFFANDADFKDPEQHVEFTKAMLKRNQFLFSHNRGTDNKMWSRLWRVPFVLQTFAHHFNFIQGQMEVPALDSELAGSHTVLALACAAVCQTLTLVADDHLTFRSSNSASVWTTTTPKGNQYEFNDTVWG